MNKITKTSDGRLIYKSESPIFTLGNDEDKDKDGILDLWEEDAAQHLNPELILDENEDLLQNLDKDKVVLFTRVTPAKVKGNDYIIFLNSITYSKDYGAEFWGGAGSHDGDTEEFQTVWKVIASNTIELDFVKTRGHNLALTIQIINKIVESARIAEKGVQNLAKGGDFLSKLNQTADNAIDTVWKSVTSPFKVFTKKRQTPIPSPGWVVDAFKTVITDAKNVEVSESGKIQIYVEEDKHGTWPSKRKCESEGPYNCGDGPILPLRGVYNVGEPSNPLIDDVTSIFPEESVWSDNPELGGDGEFGTIPFIGHVLQDDDRDEIIRDIEQRRRGDTGDFELYGTQFNDFLFGENGNDYLWGVNGDDQLLGNGGNDTLEGGAGNDTLGGGTGNDTYSVESLGDIIIENENEGIDTVKSLISYTLSNNLENLILSGINAINGTGNNLDNSILGNNAANNLSGLSGNDNLNGKENNDTLYGWFGNDTLDGWSGDDKVFGEANNDLLFGGDGSDYVNGGEDNDTLYGWFGNDTLDGWSGDDEVFGEANNDLLLGGEGNDLVNGGEDNDTLYGWFGNDTLDGGNGNDLLIAEAGNDFIDGGGNIDTISYFNSPDRVTVNLDNNSYQNENSISASPEPNFTIASGTAIDGFEGTDTLKNLENIIASQQDDILIGNSSDNKIEALEGNDLLIGNAGSDTLSGGNGNDTVSYRREADKVNVNLEAEIATEFSGDTDTLISIENVVGSVGDDKIIGSEISNIIFGEEGKDSLEGKQGNDKLIGGKDEDAIDGGEGNDTTSYFTATEGVSVNLTNRQENTGDAQGDIFQSIENLEGSEFGDRLIGDVQNNDIRGLGGDDFLDGLTGDDTMSGGTGNDAYKVESINDVVIENANQGIDTVDAAIDYILGTNLENLNLLEGTTALNGTGNELSNIINGNTGNNSLNGEAGNDTLIGFSGSDVISGGNGNDAFIYNNIADTGDLITDFTAGEDKIVVTELLQSLGYAGSDPINDGILGVIQASDSLAVLQIDPDGASSDLFRPVPFVLLNNVSAAALNDSSNFVF